MPKKKPTGNRLDKLFEDITPEEAAAQPADIARKDASGTKASPGLDAQLRPSTRPMEAFTRAAQDDLALSLALQTGQNNWGTLQVVDETAPRAWSQDEQLLVQQVADQLSLALENARLFQETQSRAEELSVLNEMGRELSAKLEISAIAEVVHRYTSRLMDTRNFFVALYDEKTEEKSYPLAFEEGRRIQLSPVKLGNSGFSDYIIRNKKTIFAPADV
ncbi:MAG TPA: GAF domain-containing protein, partial [Candidatus Binatia bacterium]|nr:GAF domain-containing protein [Candidatus Binatia bacterium]